MINIFKFTSYAVLFVVYLYLNRKHCKNIWEHYRKSSLRKYLGLTGYTYQPINHHWFYKQKVGRRLQWLPFSVTDSIALEEAFGSDNLSSDTVVATNGGRYDVNVMSKRRFSVYWNSKPNEVRRCSWFFKSTAQGQLIPYDEMTSMFLEDKFRKTFETNQWHRKIKLPNGDTVVFRRPDILESVPPRNSSADAWGNPAQNELKSIVLKRGSNEFDIDPGEPPVIDHLLLVVHGIGPICDLKGRTIEGVIDEFRKIALQLVRSHYHSSYDNKLVNRIEVLPINWHIKLHSQETGIDKKLKNITLSNIPILRDFINNTLSDILLYKSAKYSQTILTAVGTEINRLHQLFKQRNPTFAGTISLGGHSLGSLILFDLLSHQISESEQLLEEEFFSQKDLSRRISSMMLEAGIPHIHRQYPHLNFNPSAFFALGSPIGLFVTTRGLDKLGDDFVLPTCPAFFNIFHPYDPIASRIEPLVNTLMAPLKPVLIPHHKGGKRIHLQVKEALAKATADLKRKWYESMRNTRHTIRQLALFGQTNRNVQTNLHRLVQRQVLKDKKTEVIKGECEKTDPILANLNKGRRIDYVLQEAPIESFNEYIFALTLSSHLCYWESKDTMLLILKELYNSRGIVPDYQIPQQDRIIKKSNLSSQPYIAGQTATSAQDAAHILISSNTYVEPSLTVDFIRKG